MIKKDFGSIIANKRKDRKLSQPQLAALLCERGLDVKAHSISKWEKNVNLPNVLQFFALCEILEISDINRTFQIGTDEKLFSKLNDEGQAKVLDYMNLLMKSGEYIREEPIIYQFPRRTLSLYDLPVSAGTGQFLDSDRFSEIEVGDEVSSSADFGIRVCGSAISSFGTTSYVVTVWSLSIWMDRSSGFINKKHLKKEKSVSSSLMVMLM